MIYDHKTWDICLSNHVGSDIPTVDGSKKTRLDLILPFGCRTWCPRNFPRNGGFTGKIIEVPSGYLTHSLGKSSIKTIWL